MELFFKIDEDFLLNHTLSNAEKGIKCNPKYEKSLDEFVHAAKDKDRKSYENFLNGIKDNKVIHFTEEMKKTTMWKRIMMQTSEYGRMVRDEWAANQSRSLKIMEDLTGTSLDTEFEVFITHPGILNSQTIGDKKISFGGWRPDLKNVHTLFLWSEIMKIVFDDNTIENAIRETMCLEELRIRMNNGKYPPYIGSENLNSTKDQIMPLWGKYVKLKTKHLPSFVEEAQILHKFEK